MNPLIPSPDEPPETVPAGVDPAHPAAIRRWTRELLNLPDDAVVTVHESLCLDPACPVLHGTLAVFERGRTRRWHFTRPRVAVTKLALRQLLASAPAADTPASSA